MRWILILLIACSGCRKRAKPPTPEPGAPAPTSPAAVEPPTGKAPPAPTTTPGAPKRPSRVGHPGEPANPAELQGLPEKYFNQVGSFPNSWQQLIDRKYLKAVPVGKNGKPLDFRQYSEWVVLPP